MEIKMFLAIMLVCSPLNLMHYNRECFGIEDTKGYYFTEKKCYKRMNEMENDLLESLNYPAMISKDCVKVKIKAV